MSANRHRWRDFTKLVVGNRAEFANHLLRPDAESQGRVLSLLMGSEVVRVFDGACFQPSSQRELSEHPATIIMPVFNGAEFVRDSARRVIVQLRPGDRFLIIDDASDCPNTQSLVASLARDYAETVDLVRLPQNLGFVAAANIGLQRALERDAHVVLLNSDAFVPANWIARLLAPFANSEIASSTPMTNAGEIVSIFKPGAKASLIVESVDEIDQTANLLNDGANLADLPTAVGFCMAINKNWLRAFPAFSTAFGRGYGEEVDWCRRVSVAGGRHVAVPNLFVGHYAGASFGDDEKEVSLRRSQRQLAKLHPKFPGEVRRFKASDPLFSHRIALGLAYLSANCKRGVTLLIGHSLGGGAETVLQRKLAKLTRNEGGAIVLRVGGPKAWRLQLFSGNIEVSVDLECTEDIVALLRPVTPLHVIYSCGVGAAEPDRLAQNILRIVGETSASLEMWFNDYFPVSPSYCLLGSDGVYAGVPESASIDPAHGSVSKDGNAVTNEAWRAAWARLMSKADHLVVFSDTSRLIVEAAFPQETGKIDVRPHQTTLERTQDSRSENRYRNLGVLGNLNRAKGAYLVAEIAQGCAALNPTRKLVHIGSLTPNAPTHPNLLSTGSYQIDEIVDLAKRYEIGAWIMPSVWPETFSFTTHEMLATGLPVFAFPLGAQKEAVQSASNGYVLETKPTCPVAVPDEIFRVLGWHS